MVYQTGVKRRRWTQLITSTICIITSLDNKGNVRSGLSEIPILNSLSFFFTFENLKPKWEENARAK